MVITIKTITRIFIMRLQIFRTHSEVQILYKYLGYTLKFRYCTNMQDTLRSSDIVQISRIHSEVQFLHKYLGHAPKCSYCTKAERMTIIYLRHIANIFPLVLRIFIIAEGFLLAGDTSNYHRAIGIATNTSKMQTAPQ